MPPDEAATKILQGLKVDSATGPDMLPTKMLRKCADVLVKPIRMLALHILQQSAWPQASMIADFLWAIPSTIW